MKKLTLIITITLLTLISCSKDTSVNSNNSYQLKADLWIDSTHYKINYDYSNEVEKYKNDLITLETFNNIFNKEIKAISKNNDTLTVVVTSYDNTINTISIRKDFMNVIQGKTEKSKMIVTNNSKKWSTLKIDCEWDANDLATKKYHKVRFSNY